MHHLPSVFVLNNFVSKFVSNTDPMHDLPSFFSEVSLQFQHIVLNSVRRHAEIATLFSKCSVLIQQKRISFFLISVSIHFRYRHNSPYTLLALTFQIVLEYMYTLQRPNFSPQFQIVSDIVRIHNLTSLFSKCSVLI